AHDLRKSNPRLGSLQGSDIERINQLSKNLTSLWQKLRGHIVPPPARLKRFKSRAIKDALAIGHWRLGIGHSGVQSNAIMCLSDHKKIDSQRPITNAERRLC
ncbi:unnamed protein product, partial [Porites evermanni]